MQQRIRTVKPEFYRHYDLYQAERETGLPLRLAFQALWSFCDREGRFEWRPPELKLGCLPYDEVDFSRVLHALVTRGFVVNYRVGTRQYGCISSFKKHQIVNNRESPSELPSPEEGEPEVVDQVLDFAARFDACPTRADACPTPLKHAQAEGKGRELEGKGTIPPSSVPPLIASPGALLELDDPPEAPDKPPRRGTRLPDDWTPSPADIEFAEAEGLSHDQISVAADEFRDHWTARTGQIATKRDWSATWRNRVRAIAPRLTGTGPTGNRPSIIAGLRQAKRILDDDQRLYDDPWRQDLLPTDEPGA